MNKYHKILSKILAGGKEQHNNKGNIRYLLNEQLSLSPADLLDIFESHGIARKKLRNELQLFPCRASGRRKNTGKQESAGGTIAVRSL